MNKIVRVTKLGKISFRDALKIQEEISKTHLKALNAPESTQKGEDTLLLLEHLPVYTIGIRNKLYSEEEEIKLRALGADFVKTNRGGLITFHGPGQLVAYPILNLSNYKKSVKWYVSQLEETVIRMCKQFDVEAQTSKDTGVWIGNNKLAAIGIHGSRYITTHGLAINCNVDLTWFDHIVPCGIPDKGVTSLTAHLKRPVSVSEIIPAFLNAFQTQFNCQLKEIPDLQNESPSESEQKSFSEM